MPYKILLIAVTVFATANLLHAKNFSTPTEIVPAAEIPSFEDNMDFENMSTAINRQLKVLRRQSASNTITVGGKAYGISHLISSLERFNVLTESAKKCLEGSSRSDCMEKLNEDIISEFNIFRPKIPAAHERFGKSKSARFTAYYSPELESRPFERPDFKYPIYAKPSDSALARSTRDQIDFQGKFAGLGLELGYVENLFDQYILHVQGGGALKMVYEDGSSKRFYLSYDGSNKRKFSFLFKHMLKQGYIKNASSSIQRKYIGEHPEHHRDIFSVCPSYIYFKFTTHEPLGVDGIILTEGRSIAQDIGLYRQKGLISFVNGQLPSKDASGKFSSKQLFERFFIDQDTGGAIKGEARADLYMGFGKDAEGFAFNTHDFGNIFYLLLK